MTTGPDSEVFHPQDHLEYLQAAREMAASSTCLQGGEGCVIVDANGYHQGSGFKQTVWVSLCAQSRCHSAEACRGRHAGLMAAMMAMRAKCYLHDAVAYLVSETLCLTCLLALEEAGVRWVVTPGALDDDYRILSLEDAATLAAEALL